MNETTNYYFRGGTDLYGFDNPESRSADMKAAIESVLARVAKDAPQHAERFACLREFDSTRLTESQRSALTALSEIARAIGDDEGARLIFKATRSWSKK